jgi:hypothetical protein
MEDKVMNEKNILEVIDELGYLLDKYKNEIKFKDYEIERLNNKIKAIEDYTNFYSNKEN